MRKVVLVSSSFLLVGFVAGLFAGVYMFAIDVDLLGVPYSNSPVVAPSEVVIAQGNLRITIPQGAKLRYRYAAKGEPYYALDIFGKPFASRPFDRFHFMDRFVKPAGGICFMLWTTNKRQRQQLTTGLRQTFVPPPYGRDSAAQPER